MESKVNYFVIILAAGYAKRLKPLSEKIPKPLIDINGKTIISRIISNFKEAGFTNFCVVLGYKKEAIKKEVLKNKDVEILFVEQKEIIGMANAILLSINHIKRAKENITNFFITAADIIFSKNKITKIFNFYRNSKADMVLSLMKSYDLEIAKGHGNVAIVINSDVIKQINSSRKLIITDIIEKPKPNQILSEYYSLPLYLANQKIVGYLETIKLSKRGEKEFQDAIKNAVVQGDNIQGYLVIKDTITKENIGQFHLTNLKDLISMNKRFLVETIWLNLKDPSIKIIKPVRVNEDHIIKNDVILGPYVIIGKNCMIDTHSTLSNVILFDNVAIGKSCKLSWCIVDENLKVSDNSCLKDCFITKNEKNQLEIINF